MSLRVKTFPVQLDNDKSALAFDLRCAAVDWLRSRIRTRIDTAEDAGVDKKTALQKFGMAYAGAAKASRLARAVPAGLVRWAIHAEYNATFDWFPKALPRTVGTFDKSVLMKLPHDLVMVRIGGLSFIGKVEDGIPDDLAEIRVGYPEAPGDYVVTLVSGKPDDGQGMEAPEPAEPELQDA